MSRTKTLRFESRETATGTCVPVDNAEQGSIEMNEIGFLPDDIFCGEKGDETCYLCDHVSVVFVCLNRWETNVDPPFFHLTVDGTPWIIRKNLFSSAQGMVYPRQLKRNALYMIVDLQDIRPK